MQNARMKLSGKAVIVTGASRGIGRLIAIALAREGASVAVAARTTGSADTPGAIEHTTAEIEREGGTALAVRCDVTSLRETQAMARRVQDAFGRIDALVNNAAAYPRIGFLELTAAQWRKGLEVNLTGPFLCCKAVVPHMIERGGGSIVNIGSASAEWATLSGQVTYAAAKAGLIRLSTYLAMELRPHGIAVNALDPGAVRTEGVVHYVLRDGADPLEEKGYYWYPPEPGIIGPPVVYLARQTAQSMTGHVLRRYDYGKTWGEGIEPPPSPLDCDLMGVRAHRQGP